MHRQALAAVMLATFLPVRAYGQEWSPAEQEVWQVQEACWQLFVSEDLERGLDCIHDDFLGWDLSMPEPIDKAGVRNEWVGFFATGDIVRHVIEPVGIAVFGDVAVVHYRYAVTMQDLDGVEREARGRYTDVLLKQGGRWVWIADVGGETGG